MLKQIINHINSKRSGAKLQADWFYLTFYLYLDELNQKSINEYTKMIDSAKNKENQDAIKLASYSWAHDLDYSDPELYTIDILYTYLLDVYNSGSNCFKNMIKKRNKYHLYTCQYSLKSDYTYNMTQAKPGVLAYYLLALYKGGAPHFMRHILQGWNNNKSYWSSDYKESGSEMKYLSGDAMLAYPFVDVDNQPANVSIHVVNSFDNFNPSVRLENIALGDNMNNKIEYLRNYNFMNENQYQSVM